MHTTSDPRTPTLVNPLVFTALNAYSVFGEDSYRVGASRTVIERKKGVFVESHQSGINDPLVKKL